MRISLLCQLDHFLITMEFELDHQKLGQFLFDVSQFATTQYERDFEPHVFCKFCTDNYMIPVIAICLYLTMCFGGRRLMEGQKAFSLRFPLALWNMFLSTFSFLGMIRTVSTKLKDTIHIFLV